MGSDGTLLGYVLVVTNHESYGGDIQFSIGIANDGTTNGISILAIAETPGLGMEAESVLKPQYAGKNVTQFVVSEENYRFWETMRKNSGSVGDIYSPQPGKPRGNIVCEEDRDEYVIGAVSCSTSAIISLTNLVKSFIIPTFHNMNRGIER